MPLVNNYKSPKFPYGWIPVAVDIIPPNSISPPPGVRASVSPMRADRTDAAHLAIGPTHLTVNTGSTAPAWQQRAMIDSCNPLSDLCGGGDFRNWTQAAVRAAVNAINPGNKAGVYVTEEGEYGTHTWAKVGIDYGQGVGNSFNITVWNQSVQKGWFDDQMRLNINAAGGWYGGQYDGHLQLFYAFHTDMNSIRTGLASNAGAYTLAQNNTGFGNAYYTQDRGANMGGLIKAYATGDDNRNRYVAGHLAHMMIDRMARTHKGWTNRVGFFFWPGFDERVGSPLYSGQIHRRVTPSGGTVTRSCPPIWSIPAQIFIMAMAMLYDFDIFAWTEGERFGSNPAVSYPDAAHGGDPYAEVTWSGNVGEYAPASLVHTTGPVAYPHVPKGTYDIPIAAIHLSHFVRTHTTGLPAYAAVSVDGGAYPTMGTGYVIDQFLGQKVYAFKFTEGTKRTILVMDMNDPGSARNLTVDYGGGTHTFASRGGFLHASTHTVGSSAGGSSTPAADKFFGFAFVPVATSTQPANGELVLQNSRIKVVRKLDFGGSITGVYENTGSGFGPNMVNNYDHGRQIPVTIYAGPNPFNPNPALYPKPPAPHPFQNFGYDPIETGNYINQPSPIVAYGYEASTGTHYIKCRARNFPTQNFLTGYYYERWFRIVGDNIVRNWYKLTYDRGNDDVVVLDAQNALQRFHAEGNEMPIVYGNAAMVYKTAYHNGTNVITVDHRGVEGAQVYGTIATGEPWFAAVNDQNRGLGITGPAVWGINGDMHGDWPNNTGEFGGTALYAANIVQRSMDPVGVTYLMFDVVVGTIDDIRTAAQVHPASNPATTLLDYDFSTKRHDFFCQNGLMNYEGTGGAVVIDILKNNVNFRSPAQLFRASDHPVLYLRMKNESATDNLAFGFRKPGQSDGSPNNGEINFACPRDGQYHTITLNTATQLTNWTGNLSAVSVRLNIANENSVIGQNLKLSYLYIGKNNPGL